jgi:large subunit ribosomal protein L4
MKLPVLSIEGKEIRTLDVDDSVFGIRPNGAVLHQAYVAQRNNQRAGTVKTRTRGEVQGSTRKIRMQKYTGRARQGSNRAPHRVGGGIVFGPRPRDYSQDMPKKMRRLAIRSALSGKVADGQLVIIDQLSLETPKTKEIVRILGNLGFQRSALLVTGGADSNITASVRNLERAKALPAAYLNVGDMMNHAGVVMTEDAVRVAEGLWGAAAGKAPAEPKPAPARAKAAPKADGEPEAKAPVPVAEVPAEEAPASPAARTASAKPKAEAKPSTGAKPKSKADAKSAATPKASKAATPEAADKPQRRTAAKPRAEAKEAAAEAKPARRRTAKKKEEGE